MDAKTLLWLPLIKMSEVTVRTKQTTSYRINLFRVYSAYVPTVFWVAPDEK